MPLVSEIARAKINLTLRVIGRRADGYHELESLVAFADIGDGVSLDPDAPASVETSGPFANAISGKNLIDTALALLAEEEPRLRLGRVQLEKRLPVAAGIGGGSADAAAVLRAVRAANPGIVVRWEKVAAELGADVPVCFADGPAIMRGVGEIVVPIDPLPILDVVLVNPLAAVASDKTARVFKALSAPPIGAGANRDLLPEAIGDRDEFLDLMRTIGNDLALSAREVMPDVAKVIAALGNVPGIELAQMSGAGPTCFGVLASRAAAETAAIMLRQSHPDWWIEAASIG